MGEMQKILNRMRRERNKAQEETCERVGYYLVHSTGRYFISEHVSESALERVANKVLTDTDFDYWIDYSLGFDVDRRVAWANFDFTDRFI